MKDVLTAISLQIRLVIKRLVCYKNLKQVEWYLNLYDKKGYFYRGVVEYYHYGRKDIVADIERLSESSAQLKSAQEYLNQFWRERFYA